MLCELTVGRGALFQVQNQNIAVDDLDIVGDVYSGKWVISSDHDTLFKPFISTRSMRYYMRY